MKRASTPSISEDLSASECGAQDRHAGLSRCSKRCCAAGGRHRSGEYVFAVMPGDAELDLKKLAAAAGAKKAELASLKDVEPLTGYVRGGVTVMGAKKAFRGICRRGP